MKEAPPLWKIVLGVATGALLAGLIGWAVRLWLVNQAIQSVTETTARASQQILENSQRQMQAIQQKETERQLAAAQAKQEAATQLVVQQRLLAQQQMASIQAETAREDAWKRYYKKPSHCDDAVGDAFVECGNHYIRAKRKFEELYAAGKL